MRTQFVNCDTREEAERERPWAAEVLEAENGFWCFESVEDVKTFQQFQRDLFR